jgi:aminopeptidase
MAPSKPSNETASKLARSILTKNLRVKPGERVMVEAWPHTLPWAVALAREARRMKALPIVVYEDEEAYWDAVDGGDGKTIGTAASHEWAALAKTNVYIHMWGPGDRIRLNALPEKKAGDLFKFNNDWYATALKSGVRGARLEVGRPFPTLAGAYNYDQEKWTEQLVAATMVDPADLARTAAPLAKALQTGKELRITHSNGTDLTLGLAKRPARIFDGKPTPGNPKRPFDMLTNLPSGAIRVALDESVADGTIVGNRTCYFDDGVATEPVFEFSGGKLTEARFGTGGERFQVPFKQAGKGRDQPGFLAIGLNPELHNTPQVEDLEAGAVMVSVGGNRNLGGKNAAQFFGWAIAAGASVEIDGKPLSIHK